MASRVETIPEDFLQHLEKSIAGFEAESDQHKFALARMAWVGLTKINQHSHFPDAMSFSFKELDAAFGRSKFKEVNLRLDLFTFTPNWSKADSYTRGYMFSGRAREAIQDYLDSRSGTVLTRLIMADGKALKKVPAGVASKDKSGVTTRAWVNARSLDRVAVNLTALDRLKRELSGACETHRSEEVALGRSDTPETAAIERTVAMISKIQLLSRTDVCGVGVMAHHYEEAQSGRLYPVGINLASAQSVVKDAALEGHWEYDISNCHFAIASQMASKHGYECVAITNYLRNKDSVRLEISKGAGINKEQAKKCLLALLYGARASKWKDTAIAREIGEAATERLIAVPDFKALMVEIRGAREWILSKCERTARGFVRNAFGKSISDAATMEQQFAHLLQGVEAKALQAAINAYPDDIVLVQHDGFVSRRRLDLADLGAAMRTATGYTHELEEEHLKARPEDYFSTHL